MKHDYERMKVADLKKLASERNIVVDGMKKPDIVATLASADSAEAKARAAAGAGMVEAQVVEAELIEPAHVELVPAVINSAVYLDTRREWLDEMMEPYRDMDDEAIAAMDAREAKLCRADLNRIIKEVDGERKAIKRAYNEPLERFERAVGELLEPAKRDAARLKEYIDDQAEIARELRCRELEAVYNDFAPALVPVVPFERVLEINPKWLNASYNAEKAARELEDAVAKVAKDWEVLKRQAPLMRFYEEAEAVFFRTLDLNEAIAHNDMREEEQQRIDAMKAEVEQNRAASHTPPPQFEEVPPEEPEPMPPVDTIDPATGEYIGCEPDFDPETGAVLEPEPQPDLQAFRTSYVIRIDLTPAEKGQLMDYLVSNGIGANRFIGIAKENSNA